MRLRLLALLAVAMVIASSPAWAFDVTWQFATSGSNGNFGTSKMFTGSDATSMITAYGNLTAGGTTDLFGKFTLGDPTETGLGIASQVSHEIDNSQFIQFDVSSLLSSFIGGSFTIGSLQSGESFEICESNTLGDIGTCGSAIFESGSTTQNTVSLMDWGSFDFYSITAASGDVLVDSFAATPVPEPVSMLLLGSGLLGLGFLRRRFGSST
ncbi:MAG TPA: PEP-CTERM sorting domain-containing protein [Terriglobia bacterium]|nr:PEP-CTERM sorting domain-containing protein [Terriglobia bacterium]